MSEKRVGIVTGASTGLGFATAKKLADMGIYTFLIGRDEEKLTAACARIGKDCEPVVFDVNHLDKIPQVVDQIASRFGQIDVLVNNAGINQKKKVLEVSDEEFEKVILTNLKSVFTMTREVVRHMVKKNRGSIINISSMAAQYGLPYVIAYSASKTAVEGMTRALAVELASAGIRVNCIAPGFITTNMTAKALDSDPERKGKAIGRTPMGRMGAPEDIANAAYFLASDESSFMTGTVIPVDGGNSIGF